MDLLRTQRISGSSSDFAKPSSAKSSPISLREKHVITGATSVEKECNVDCVFNKNNYTTIFSPGVSVMFAVEIGEQKNIFQDLFRNKNDSDYIKNDSSNILNHIKVASTY